MKRVVTATIALLIALTMMSFSSAFGLDRNAMRASDKLARIEFEGGYLRCADSNGQPLDVPEYHFYHRDHLGNNRMDVNADGGISQITHYYPYGMPMDCSHIPGYQRRLFGGKELDSTSGLDLYDFEARAYDPALGRFHQPDPLTESYQPLSPYLYCAANPLIDIDPTGKVVIATGSMEQNAILMTLRKEDRKYVKFDANGVLAADLIKLNISDSENYNSLCFLSTAPQIVEVISTNSYSYKDKKGEIETMTLGNIEYDDFFKEDNPINPTGPTTGETGKTGITLLPGNGESGINSPNERIYIIINEELSPLGAAEAFSHEGYGHGFMYLQTGSRTAAAHNFISGGRDGNSQLIQRIMNSILETIKNNE